MGSKFPAYVTRSQDLQHDVKASFILNSLQNNCREAHDGQPPTLDRAVESRAVPIPPWCTNRGFPLLITDY